MLYSTLSLSTARPFSPIQVEVEELNNCRSPTLWLHIKKNEQIAKNEKRDSCGPTLSHVLFSHLVGFCCCLCRSVKLLRYFF